MPAASPALPAPPSLPGVANAGLRAIDDPVEVARFTRWRDSAEGQREADSSLRVSGMVCTACAGVIETALARVDGVRSVRVSAAAERAQVIWDPARTRASALIAAIRAAGYDAVPDTTADIRAQRDVQAKQALWRWFVAVFCGMQVMMLATPSYVAAPGELAPDLRTLLNWGAWVLSLPVLLFSAAPFFRGAWGALRQGRIAMDVPVALGLLVTFVASTGATFAPEGVFGAEVYFDSLTMFVAFLLGARWLETRARHRALDALEASLDALPETAQRVAADGTLEQVGVRALVPGDRVRVTVGSGIPADGQIVLGATEVVEALLTGESRPVVKAVGDRVLAGSVNVGAPLEMEVRGVGTDTRHAAIVALMREAATQRPAIARSVDRWAAPFLWTVLTLALAAGLWWWVMDPTRAIWVVVSVLIVTCPCALSLAAPSALLSTAGRLARSGVLLHRLDALDAMARVTTVYIDKTGTLTRREPVLRTQVRLGPAGASANAMLAAAASLAAWSTHPLAQALRTHVAASLPSETRAAAVWLDVREIVGQGVTGEDAQGRRWRLGSATFLGATSALDAPLALWFGDASGAQVRFEFEEALREDAAQAVANLTTLGVGVRLLSGDQAARVQAIAQGLGLVESEGDATPERKLAVLREAQARGEIVAMVGDGVNDAPVLACADASFAMGEGALVARSSADAVVLSSRLTEVSAALALARRCRRIVWQNFAWAGTYNAVCVPLAVFGWLPPWAAGLGMATSSLVVIGNALRLAR